METNGQSVLPADFLGGGYLSNACILCWPTLAEITLVVHVFLPFKSLFTHSYIVTCRPTIIF